MAIEGDCGMQLMVGYRGEAEPLTHPISSGSGLLKLKCDTNYLCILLEYRLWFSSSGMITQDSAYLRRAQVILMQLVFGYTLSSEALDLCRSLLQHVWSAQLLGG